MTTYLACPDKFKWTYIDDRGKWYLKSKHYYSFGTSLHNVLQRFHDQKDAGVTTTSEAIAALEESWIEAGYESQDAMLQALSEGKDILESYIENFKAQPVTAQTIYIEKRFRCDCGRFDLIGQIDRVDELQDGSLEIIDYKSGRSSVEVGDIQHDLAMNCYALLLLNKHPQTNISATIIALKTGQKATYNFNEGELAVFQKDLVVLGQEILDRDFENLLPTKKELCTNCDFLPLCRKHPEFS